MGSEMCIRDRGQGGEVRRGCGQEAAAWGPGTQWAQDQNSEWPARLWAEGPVSLWGGVGPLQGSRGPGDKRSSANGERS